MGWIVGAPENGYVDTVKNANKVDFIGKGISVTGKTNDKGIREITIAVKDGEVVKTKMNLLLKSMEGYSGNQSRRPILQYSRY